MNARPCHRTTRPRRTLRAAVVVGLAALVASGTLQVGWSVADVAPTPATDAVATAARPLEDPDEDRAAEAAVAPVPAEDPPPSGTEPVDLTGMTLQQLQARAAQMQAEFIEASVAYESAAQQAEAAEEAATTAEVEAAAAITEADAAGDVMGQQIEAAVLRRDRCQPGALHHHHQPGPDPRRHVRRRDDQRPDPVQPVDDRRDPRHRTPPGRGPLRRGHLAAPDREPGRGRHQGAPRRHPGPGGQGRLDGERDARGRGQEGPVRRPRAGGAQQGGPRGVAAVPHDARQGARGAAAREVPQPGRPALRPLAAQGRPAGGCRGRVGQVPRPDRAGAARRDRRRRLRRVRPAGQAVRDGQRRPGDLRLLGTHPGRVAHPGPPPRDGPGRAVRAGPAGADRQRPGRRPGVLRRPRRRGGARRPQPGQRPDARR